jgi:hypothetical protein
MAHHAEHLKEDRRMVDTPHDPYLAERYFTDGVNLFRLVGWLSRPCEPPLAELEDCSSLYSDLLERDDLDELALHPVAFGAGVAS